MSFWKNLETALNVAIAANAVNEGNKWINQKKIELRHESTKENALIEIAQSVGSLDNEEWKVFISGVRLKAIGDPETDNIRKYCEMVVQTETNEFQQLLTMNLDAATNILATLIDRNPLERCIYIGLLLSKNRDVRAKYLLNNIVDTMNNRLHKSHNVIPKGKIHKITNEFGVKSDNEWGMNIHLDVTIENSLNAKCSVIAWFYYSDGRILKDINNRYRTSNGQVCTWKDFVPPYDDARYRDISIFMPYSEFDLTAPGVYNLKFCVGLFNGHDQLDTTDFEQITYTKS